MLRISENKFYKRWRHEIRHRGPPVKIAPGPLPFNPALGPSPAYSEARLRPENQIYRVWWYAPLRGIGGVANWLWPNNSQLITFIEDNSIASTVTGVVVAKKFSLQARNWPETFWQTWAQTGPKPRSEPAPTGKAQPDLRLWFHFMLLLRRDDIILLFSVDSSCVLISHCSLALDIFQSI